MILKIFAAAVLFLTYFGTIIFTVIMLVNIVRGLETLWENTAQLIPEEQIEEMKKTRFAPTYEVFTLHRQMYLHKFGLISYVCLGAFPIMGMSCYFSGLYIEGESPIIYKALIAAGCVGVALFLAFFIFDIVLERKYKVAKYFSGEGKRKFGKRYYPVRVIEYRHDWIVRAICGIPSVIMGVGTLFVTMAISVMCM